MLHSSTSSPALFVGDCQPRSSVCGHPRSTLCAGHNCFDFKSLWNLSENFFKQLIWTVNTQTVHIGIINWIIFEHKDSEDNSYSTFLI